MDWFKGFGIAVEAIGDGAKLARLIKMVTGYIIPRRQHLLHLEQENDELKKKIAQIHS